MRPTPTVEARPETVNKRIMRAYAILSNPNELITYRLDALDQMLGEKHCTAQEAESAAIYSRELARQVGATGKVITVNTIYRVDAEGRLCRRMR